MKILTSPLKFVFISLCGIGFLSWSVPAAALDGREGNSDGNASMADSARAEGGPRIFYVNPGYNNNIYSYPSIQAADETNDRGGPLVVNNLNAKVLYNNRGYGNSIYSYPSNVVPDPHSNLEEVEISAMEPVINDEQSMSGNSSEKRIFHMNRAYNNAIYGYDGPGFNSDNTSK